MVKQKSFLLSLLADVPFAIKLASEVILVSAIAIWTICGLENLLLAHRDFIFNTTTEILQNEAIWQTAAYALAGLGAIVVFGIAVGKLLAWIGGKYPEARE